MILYKEINLPKIPEELLSFDVAHTVILPDIGYGLEHTKDHRNLNPCEYSFGQITDTLLIDWIKTHLIDFEISNVLMQIQYHPTGGTHIVHSDIKRTYALNYMLELGESATTSWYKEHGKPLMRTKQSGVQQSNDGAVEYKNLETLESVVFEKHKWYLIATGVLHDVDVIVGTRKSISIAVTDFKMFKFLTSL